MEYSYPISMNWSTQEIIQVVQFFESIEKAYEKGISKNVLMGKYRRFKEVVPSIGEEKRIFSEFEKSSGMSAYQVIKKMKTSDSRDWVKM